MPDVSIILPTRNRAGMLQEAIGSVLAQTRESWELIIIDDGSSDGTPEYLETWRKRDARIKITRTEGIGPSGARNAGIKAARGAYVAFLDDDDLWTPRKLERQLAYMEGHPDVGLVYGRARVIDKSNNSIGVKPEHKEVLSFEDLLKGNGIPTCTALVRRQCLKQVGGFDCALRLSQDYDLWLRIASEFRLGYVPEVLASYRRHEGNSSGNPALRVQSHIHSYRKLLTQDMNRGVRRQLVRRLAYSYHLLGRFALYYGDMALARRHLSFAFDYWRQVGGTAWRFYARARSLWLLSYAGVTTLKRLRRRWELQEPQLFCWGKADS